MRNLYVLLACLLLLPQVTLQQDADAAKKAEGDDDDLVIDMKDRPPTEIKAHFLEQFTPSWKSRWQASEATKAEGDKQFRYSGEWAVEKPHAYPGLLEDLGLVAKSEAAHHAISAQIEPSFDNTDKTLVLQYEVKLQEGLNCGGAYMKLLTQSPEGVKFKEFDDKTPYTIMFGPDKCGMTDKVHFIFRYKHPKTGEYEEKHLRDPPTIKGGKLSHVYTLVVRPDNTFEILVDRESVRKGSLYEDFEPTVLPPKEIDDIEDRMPDDWVVDPTIPDPAAKKPDDWDENAPYEIPDPAAKKPDDWFENEEAMVVDPEAVKPADWDAEEDGEWQAPLITNPKCEDASGCGPWSAPMIKNPAFKGQWYAPTIANPAFKGHWRPRKIPNPDFFDDQHVSNFEKIAAIGFEIWTMQSGILFDNVYLGHSEDDAKQLADETWAIKHAIEKAMLEAETVQDLEDDKNNDPVDDEDVTLAKQPVKFIRQQVNKFILMSKEDVLEAVFEMPYVAAGLLGAVLMLLAAVFSVLGLVSGGSSSTEETDKSTKKEEASSAAEGTEGESTATPKKTVKRKKKNAKE